MKQIFFISFLFLLFNQENTTKSDVETISPVENDEMYFHFQYPYDIQFNIDSLKGLSFGTDTLDLANVLFTLFPAQWNENCLNYDDNEPNVAYWVCSSCEPHIFPITNYYGDDFAENDTLPYDNWNFTYITHKINYIDKQGIESCLISFSTADDYPPSGRLTDGLLSLALFKKETEWKLIAFNPFADYQGSFKTADPASKVIILPQKDELFVVWGGFANGICVGGNGYCPHRENLYLYESLTATRTVEILAAYVKNAWGDFGSKWDTEITVLESQSDTSILQITTQGIIDKEYLWYVPLELAEMDDNVYDSLPDIFNFEIVRYYAYLNGKMSLTDKKLRYNYK